MIHSPLRYSGGTIVFRDWRWLCHRSEEPEMTPSAQKPVRGMFQNGMPYFTTGSGRPVVFLPGISGSHGPSTRFGRWSQAGQVALLARHHEVWWIGHPPALPPDLDMARLAGEYAGAIRHYFHGPVDVIGVSTGGSIALQLAADHPDVIHRLVLVSSAYRLGARGRLAQNRTARFLRAGRPRRAASELMSRLGRNPFESKAMSVAGWMLGQIVVGDDDPDLLVMLDAEDAFDLHRRLPEVAAPTLVIGGDSDGFYPETLFRETASAIPTAQIIVYRGVGHMTTQGNHRLANDARTFLSADTLSLRDQHRHGRLEG